MSHVPHDLADALGTPRETIAAREAADAHFAKAAAEYHVLNRAIHRAETNVEPTSDDHLHDMKKRRLALLDTMHASLATA